MFKTALNSGSNNSYNISFMLNSPFVKVKYLALLLFGSSLPFARVAYI